MQTLVDRARMLKPKTAMLRGFMAELEKLAVVSDTEALSAADTLSEHRPFSRYLSSAALGAAAVPATKAVGRAVEAGLGAPRGQRLARAGKAMLAATGPELGKQLAEGAVGGGVVRAVGEGMDVARARQTALAFLRQQEAKEAAMVNPVAVTSEAGSSAALASTVGRFKGMATANSLKPPGPANPGVVDPRRSIKSSITSPR